MNHSEILFSPLRRKKTGQLIITPYLKWNKLVVEKGKDRLKLIFPESILYTPGEPVFNSKLQQLFFFNYSPYDMKIYTLEDAVLSKVNISTGCYGIQFENIVYSGFGIDCNGTPAFSHYTKDYIKPNKLYEISPLTADTVLLWYGWFVYQLKNRKTVFQESEIKQLT